MSWSQDLLPTLTSCLDRHLIIPLLRFQEETAPTRAEKRDAQLALLHTLVRTSMIDYALEVWQEIEQDQPLSEDEQRGLEGRAALAERRESIVLALKTLHIEVRPLLQAVSKVAKEAQISKSDEAGIVDDKAPPRVSLDLSPTSTSDTAKIDGETEASNLEELPQLDASVLDKVRQIRDVFSEDLFDALYEYARFQFDCGNYAESRELLRLYRALVPDLDWERDLGLHWGMLASEILENRWEPALQEIENLRAFITSLSGSSSPVLNPLQQLQQRTWLLHWGLFVFFQSTTTLNYFIDLVFSLHSSSGAGTDRNVSGSIGNIASERYFTAIETNAAHLYRYVVAALAICNKRQKRNLFAEVVRSIDLDGAKLSKDPVVGFVESLWGNLDLGTAEDMLRECESALRQDYFLRDSVDAFQESGLQLIFEMYCRTHDCIDLHGFADRLNMDRARAERWVASLVRSARLDAKIDDRRNQVLMSYQPLGIYEYVIDTTRSLTYRTSSLGYALDRDTHPSGGTGRLRGHGRTGRGHGGSGSGTGAAPMGGSSRSGQREARRVE
jgi:hypothetical protein